MKTKLIILLLSIIIISSCKEVQDEPQKTQGIPIKMSNNDSSKFSDYRFVKFIVNGVDYSSKEKVSLEEGDTYICEIIIESNTIAPSHTHHIDTLELQAPNDLTGKTLFVTFFETTESKADIDEEIPIPGSSGAFTYKYQRNYCIIE